MDFSQPVGFLILPPMHFAAFEGVQIHGEGTCEGQFHFFRCFNFEATGDRVGRNFDSRSRWFVSFSTAAFSMSGVRKEAGSSGGPITRLRAAATNRGSNRSYTPSKAMTREQAEHFCPA